MNDRHPDGPAAPAAIASISGEAPDTDGASITLAQFITFAIGQDQYGVDIMAVREIKGWSEITHLPEQPDYMRGVLNLRGAIVPIVDLRCRFGEGLTEGTPLHVIIIVQIGDQLVGLLADRVSDIISIDPAKIKAVPKIAETARFDFLLGIVTVEAAMIALIELSHLLDQPAGESKSTGGRQAA
jgi:purine-binding chemotaxis protein CheW